MAVRLVAERLSWTVAASCLSVWAFVQLVGSIGARDEIARFDAARASEHRVEKSPDLSLWSPQRIHAWRETLGRPAPPPLGVLRIARVRLEAPVLEGDDEWSLNRGVGHIADTASPGADGNAGLAGHRDGFFRVLKDVEPGDTIELETLRGTQRYRVERAWIVNPDDVSVLDPSERPSLTLVTCYPFYFVGSAPQRYIVRAAREQ